MKKEKCLCCGKALEFEGLCYECSLPLNERLALKEARDKKAIERFGKFIKKSFGADVVKIEK